MAEPDNIKRVLVVEDDISVAEMVSDLAGSLGLVASLAYKISDARMHLETLKFDLLILDWELPDGSGAELCAAYRDCGGNGAVLMLTGRTSVTDKEQGFLSGADDYLCKPFFAKELALRCKALLRRSAQSTTSLWASSGISLDLKGAIFRWNEHEVQLPARELSLLDFLMRHPNRHFSAKDLVERVWDDKSDTTEAGLRSCIHRLKDRLHIEGYPPLISSSKSYGYALCTPSKAEHG